MDILGVSIAHLGLQAAVERCHEDVTRAQGGYVCFVNVHLLSESTRTPWLRDILNGARYALADGTPLVWVARRRGETIAPRPCGPDFMDFFLKQYPDLRHAMIGGPPGQATALIERYRLTKALAYSPPMRPFSAEAAREDWQAVLRLAQTDSAPQMVWVGLGAPKQEQWMAEVSRLAPQTLFLGVGAAFDFLTQSKPRAPRWMRRSGLEWVHRFASEPKRLGRRYVEGNTRFLWKLLREEFQRRKA